jgi:NitT/TauT family transport system substrate-binding protein
MGITRPRVLIPVLALALAAALSGCGRLAGMMGAQAATGPGPLEKTTLNVSVVPALDSAGFFVALHDGLFARQGLTVNYTPATSSDTVINQQVAGKLDITGGNYVSYIQHFVNDRQPLEIIGEGSLIQAGTQALYTMPHSKITSLNDLRGKLIGVNAPGNINYLLAASLLTENGIPLSSVRFPAQPIPMPKMADALAAGQFDAVSLPEPFATIAEQKYGAVRIADSNQGATQDFPIQGYVVTRTWAVRNPDTLQAFVNALSQGQQIADTNRSAVEGAMESLAGPPNGQVPPVVGSVMALNNYPISIDPVRLQRVPDVMQEFGLLQRPFNIKNMLAAG